MTLAATEKPTCGARRPGWEHGPAIGINRIPCVLDPFHTDDHANAWAQRWPRLTPVRCVLCGRDAVDPAPVSHQEAASGPGHTRWACSPVCSE